MALPILSAMGIDTAVLPTALLSTHSGFDDFFVHDLSSDFTPITDHWKKQGFSFDAIYTGYLGSEIHVDHVKDFVKDFRRDDTLLVVDPAMADEGKMYSGISSSFASHIHKIINGSDVILPNLTEASFLLGEDLFNKEYTEEDIISILKDLSKLGTKNVVLKGVSFTSDQKNLKGIKGKIGNVAYDSTRERITWHFHKKINQSFCGAGDVFASSLTGALLRGTELDEAISVSGDFVLKSIKKTMEEDDYSTLYIDFEKALPWLMKKIGILK